MSAEAGENELIAQYEKEIFDLRQLLEISKSLNSTLEFNQLLESILYTCMAQAKVLQAAVFTRTEVHRADLHLHRNLIGFDVAKEHHVIPEESDLLRLFLEQYRCYTMEEIEETLPGSPDLGLLNRFQPSLLVPIRSRNLINGVIVLGEKIPQDGRSKAEYGDTEKDFLLDVALLAGIAVHNAFLFEVTNTDLMTRLKMRHYFLTMLAEAMQRAQSLGEPLSVMMLDLDNFKRINDTYGHLFGDDVLREVADVVLTKVRRTDLAARYGGEEFIVLLPSTEGSRAMAIAERVRKGVASTTFEYEENRIPVTISIGVATYKPEVDKTSHMLIDRVDRALYCSKRDGRNRSTEAF
ncbi:MAG: diguanylate cyclase DgcA [Alkalispirochaetaceae bacterium]